jgi:hypothetical protein
MAFPLALLSICSGDDLRFLTCGEDDIDLSLLKSVTTYKGGLNTDSDVVKWFWEVLEEFTPVRCIARLLGMPFKQ